MGKHESDKNKPLGDMHGDGTRFTDDLKERKKEKKWEWDDIEEHEKDKKDHDKSNQKK